MTLTAPARITSRSVQQIANTLRAGRHPLAVGRVGDFVLLSDEVLGLGDAIERIACSSFDIVLRVNAADCLEVVQGDEQFRRVCDDTAESDPVIDEELPQRERRMRDLLPPVPLDEDVIVTVRRCLTQGAVSVFVIIEQADILLQDPAHHDLPDRDRVARLQLALRDAARVGQYRNTCALIAGEARAIPAVLLDGIEDITMIEVEAPTRDERAAYLRTVVATMYGAGELGPDALDALIEELALLTDGESLRTLESLAAWSARGRRSVRDPRALVNLHRFGDRPDYWAHLGSRLLAIRAQLMRRVFGQPAAIDAVMNVLAAAALGLEFSGNARGAEGQPRGVLWFVGPTGVGKTELAKAIAEAVFGDSEAYLRFDMSTFAQEHAAERLMGAPPGYIGFERGGELTNAVRGRPNSVVLLDEIEKAHPTAVDRVMSILDDGRVADAQGRVTYFGETIIIATSNVGAEQLSELIRSSEGKVEYERIRAVSVRAVRDHFMGISRPEIFGRIEMGVVAFDVLRPEMVDQIATKMVEAASFTHGPKLAIDAPSACAMARGALVEPEQQALGGRQVRNVFRRRLLELSSWLALNGHLAADRVEVRFADDAMFASVDGGEALRVT